MKQTKSQDIFPKRRLELLGLCLTPNTNYSRADIEVVLGIERATLNRDLLALRSEGVDIHSVRGKLQVISQIPRSKAKQLVTQYLGQCQGELHYDKATALLVAKVGGGALGMVVTLQRAIEGRRFVQIEYLKEANDTPSSRKVAPLMLFQAEGEWRLLGEDGGIIKQFILTKIRSFRPLESRFKDTHKDQIELMFANMWAGWLGPEAYLVRLKFDEERAGWFLHRPLTENQKIIPLDDGGAILETSVPNLEEVGSWVIARGEGVTVLDPPGLRSIVIERAQAILRNHQ